MGKDVTSTIRVRYAETDAQGVVYHSNYLVWFEVGRGDFLRAAGVDYNALEASGAFVVVVEAHVRYHSPARYDQELVVHTRLAETRTRSLKFAYQVVQRDTGTVVASGWTAHVVVNREGRPVPIPEILRQAIAQAGLAPEPTDAPFQGDALISPQA